MSTLGDLMIKVGADISGFRDAMGDVSTTLARTVRDAEKEFKGFDKIGSSLSGLGTTLSTAITLPLVGAGALALNVAGNFEQSMAKITAYGDISGASLEKLRNQALQLGKDTAFSAQQAADGMAVFASAGFTAEKIYAAMPGTLALAAAGQLAIAEAATITKDVLGEFQLKAADSGRVADVLAQASADASASLSEMASTLTYAGPAAAGAGQSLEETTAAIIALDAAGIRGEKAGTGLRGVLASLVAPSSDAAKYMEELGIKISNSSGHIKPLSDIMEDFKQKLANVGGEAERQRIVFEVFGREAGNSAQVLINTGGPALDAMEQKLVHAGGAADKMAKTLNSGLNYALDQLKGSVETAGIALGTALIPVAKDVLDILTKVLNNAVIPAVEGFSALPEPVQNVALGLAGVAVAAGPVVLVAGQLISSFATVGAAVTAIGGSLPLLASSFTSVGYAVANGLTGALSGGELAILRCGQAAVVAAAAFAAWELGSWAYKNIPAVKALGDTLANLLLKIPGVETAMFKLTGVSAAQSKAASDLDFVTKKLEDTLAKHGVTVDKTGLTTDQYATKLREAAKEIKTTQINVENINKPLKTHTTELGKAEKAAAKAAATLDDRLNPSFHELQKAADDVQKEVADVLGEVAAAQRDFGVLAAEMLNAANQIDIFATGVHGAKEALATLDHSTLPVDNLTAAFKTLGVTSSTELGKTAAAAKSAYETILNSGIATEGEINAAWAKMTAASDAYATSMGEIPADKIESINTSLKAQPTLWTTVQDAMGSIGSSIKNDLGGAIGALISGKGSIGDLGDAFKKVGQDIVDTIVNNIIQFGIQKLFDSLANVHGLLGTIGSALGGIPTGGSGGGIFSGGLSTIFHNGDPGGLSGVNGMPGVDLASSGSSSAGAGSALSGTLGTVTGVLGAVGSIGSMVSGIIGNFQSAHQETSLNAIEHNTRYAAIYLGEGGDESIFGFTKYMRNFFDGYGHYLFDVQHADFMNVIDSIERGNGFLTQLRDFAMAPARAANYTFKILLDGKELTASVVQSLEESGIRT